MRCRRPILAKTAFSQLLPITLHRGRWHRAKPIGLAERLRNHQSLELSNGSDANYIGRVPRLLTVATPGTIRELHPLQGPVVPLEADDRDGRETIVIDGGHESTGVRRVAKELPQRSSSRYPRSSTRTNRMLGAGAVMCASLFLRRRPRQRDGTLPATIPSVFERPSRNRRGRRSRRREPPRSLSSSLRQARS